MTDNKTRKRTKKIVTRGATACDKKGIDAKSSYMMSDFESKRKNNLVLIKDCVLPIYSVLSLH